MTDQTPRTDSVAVLYVNRSESRCGACNQGCDPYEETHETLLGWYAVNDRIKGCGARFTGLSSDYIGLLGLESDVRAIRPDLPWLGEKAR